MTEEYKSAWVPTERVKRTMRSCRISDSGYQMIETEVLEGICSELLEYRQERLNNLAEQKILK